MAHVMSMFSNAYLAACDLNGRDVALTVARVTAGEVVGEGGKKSKKPLLYFATSKRPLALNKTNARTMVSMFGAETDRWVGKRIVLFPTTTKMGLETVECVRIRPRPAEDRHGATPANFGERGDEREDAGDGEGPEHHHAPEGPTP